MRNQTIGNLLGYWEQCVAAAKKVEQERLLRTRSQQAYGEQEAKIKISVHWELLPHTTCAFVVRQLHSVIRAPHCSTPDGSISKVIRNHHTKIKVEVVKLQV